MMGFHLDGQICRVGCAFCYLGQRTGGGAESARTLPAGLLEDIVSRLLATEIAVSISEPARRWRAGLEALAAAAQRHGKSLTITTTPDVVAADPWVLRGASRVSLSVDPAKHSGRDAWETALTMAKREGLEVIALVSLATPDFADALAGGLIAELLARPEIDAVSLNGLKPPPPWCDRAFWLRFCSRIRPLLEEHLHRRLHLDCYVGARILGLGGCPAKPDISPGREFRSCVYQAEPDFVFADAVELARRVSAYVPPAVCPFVIR